MRIPGVLRPLVGRCRRARVPQQIGQNKAAGETQSFTLTVQVAIWSSKPWW